MTDEVLRRRAALESAAEGRTLCDQLLATANAFGDLPAYSDRDGDAVRGRPSPGSRPGSRRCSWRPGSPRSACSRASGSR